MTELRERLRALPSFPPDLPRFDPEHDPADAPADPRTLFVAWLEEALAAGAPTPQAAVLATATADGVVGARTLIVKDVTDDAAWLFATHRTSPKARAAEANPHAAMTFFWPTHGRQVRVSGRVRRLPDDVAAADFSARPEASRAATLVGRQSEPLGSRAELGAAFDASLARVQADPDLVDAAWALYAVDAVRVEFWQAVAGGGAVRWAYERDGVGRPWRAGLLWP
ncbi:pyridoxamine 5'-phosphate oxidase [Luteimicrobium album]|uniref:Pyridoxamine 5'-phosphate oxidase n=1 Tax=Luteimicrobium album TaxID=1054550 RepID=A0ABQ6I1C4_9MICO|nr:pyridoxal 5'-phosphate synthase [Luteimicrobium album]GMA24031.1 pyridoxamine 5'-phosphate oxidase [Luteimicrobium album]